MWSSSYRGVVLHYSSVHSRVGGNFSSLPCVRYTSSVQPSWRQYVHESRHSHSYGDILSRDWSNSYVFCVSSHHVLHESYSMRLKWRGKSEKEVFSLVRADYFPYGSDRRHSSSFVTWTTCPYLSRPFAFADLSLRRWRFAVFPTIYFPVPVIFTRFFALERVLSFIIRMEWENRACSIIERNEVLRERSSHIPEFISSDRVLYWRHDLVLRLDWLDLFCRHRRVRRWIHWFSR